MYSRLSYRKQANYAFYLWQINMTVTNTACLLTSCCSMTRRRTYEWQNGCRKCFVWRSQPNPIRKNSVAYIDECASRIAVIVSDHGRSGRAKSVVLNAIPVGISIGATRVSRATTSYRSKESAYSSFNNLNGRPAAISAHVELLSSTDHLACGCLSHSFKGPRIWKI